MVLVHQLPNAKLGTADHKGRVLGHSIKTKSHLGLLPKCECLSRAHLRLIFEWGAPHPKQTSRNHFWAQRLNWHLVVSHKSSIDMALVPCQPLLRLCPVRTNTKVVPPTNSWVKGKKKVFLPLYPTAVFLAPPTPPPNNPIAERSRVLVQEI